MTTTLGISMKKTCVLCFVQPLAMFFALVPINMWSVLYDVQTLAFGIVFLGVAVAWSYITNRTGLPMIKARINYYKHTYSQFHKMIHVTWSQ